ncbi:hypothetical protein R3Q06_33590 [Rhodococcus erythropolis]|uniref:hypothetical protein n=1 Tax=Rhodococcus erythropolis TaxID=1833 RepID=UPI002949EA33|nr:hypothetical protein [Rhodococcus erythropolis]MDV6278367.1 hypothetical protein [Rhodococcus erythropolis]
MTTTRRNPGLRTLLYIPLAAAVLAGAVCAGTGIGSAASTIASDPVTGSTAPGHDLTDKEDGWHLINGTDQPLSVVWTERNGNNAETLGGGKPLTLQPGALAAAQAVQRDGTADNTYWWGHVLCFNHMGRNLNGLLYNDVEPADVKLVKTNDGRLAVQFFYHHDDVKPPFRTVVLEDNRNEPC